MYKAVITYSNELRHVNKNHDKLGRFTFGDGDGDGIVDESRFTKRERQKIRKERQTLGSKQTQNAFDKMTVSKNRKELRKSLREYEKLSKKDVKEALKLGDEEAANMINSGRMFYKALMDDRYKLSVVRTAFKQLKTVELGSEFTYNLAKDPEIGGLKVSLMAGDKKYTTTVKD